MFWGSDSQPIAREAHVAVETVYRSTSGKAGLLREGIQASLAGRAERAELAVEHRPGIQRVIECPRHRPPMESAV